MSLFAIGDLHLSLSSKKPMDVFGGAWHGYIEKIEKNWRETVSPEDTVVLVGDTSWAMSLQGALEDFRMIESLPGKKLIVKGNHDYFWTTATKMKSFFEENGLFSLNILHNNYYEHNGAAICGTRGWFYDEATSGEHDEVVFKRELIRLEASLSSAKNAGFDEIYCFLHYPPVCLRFECIEIMQLLQKFGVCACYSGHLHGKSHGIVYEGEALDVEYFTVSADYVCFRPQKVL